MQWILLLEILYLIIVVFTCYRIIIDTRSSTKALAYLLAVFFIPVLGVIIYFAFGVNYKKRKIYSKKILTNEALQTMVAEMMHQNSLRNIERNTSKILDERIPKFILRANSSPLTTGNKIKIFGNGEDKFEAVFQAIEAAESTVHIEYYIMEAGVLTERLEKLLFKKIDEGVKVRVVYDDFGSRSIRKDIPRRWRERGIEIFPFYKIKLVFFASRLNYRNHRKIIVIDGKIGFLGGINWSDRYDNTLNNNHFWRDSHVYFEGPIVAGLQAVFLADWNFCSQQPVTLSPELFQGLKHRPGDKLVQVAAGGPDYPMPTILYSLLQAIYNAEKYIYATTPYYIPDESLQNALCVMAKTGLDVRLIVPHASDSRIVDAASRSYYSELLESGVRIFRYTKGFIHVKTLVIDDCLSIIGTANLDYRSFDLNFEVNAVIYDEENSIELRKQFELDLENSDEVNLLQWMQRSPIEVLKNKAVGLISPLL